MGMRTAPGWFITFEGIEGCGKSTQLAKLADWLQANEHTVLTTKEPGGTSIGRDIRAVLLNAKNNHMAPACEALLYLADRAQHHHEVIIPALARGTVVLSDRYHDSTRAYQAAARGLGQPELDRIFQMAADGLEPDLTLLLDLDVETGLGRARARNQAEDTAESEGRFEAETLRFHQMVRNAFLSLAKANPNRFRVIDAAADPETIANVVKRHVSTYMRTFSHV